MEICLRRNVQHSTLNASKRLSKKNHWNEETEQTIRVLQDGNRLWQRTDDGDLWKTASRWISEGKGQSGRWKTIRRRTG